jgi:hypothetical protein
MEFSLAAGLVMSSTLLMIVIAVISFAVPDEFMTLNSERFSPTVQSGRSWPPMTQIPSWKSGTSS